MGLLLVSVAPCETRVLSLRRAAFGSASRTSARSHREAVVDRMYSDALAADYLRSLELLDPEVGLHEPPATLL